MYTTAARTRRLVLMAILLAVLLLLSVTPISYIGVGPVSITIAHIPIFIALLCEGLGAGLLMAFFFGAISFLRAWTPTKPLDILFTNPLVSILPRLLIPIIAWAAYKAVRKLVKPTNLMLPWAAAGLCGTLTNTIGVLGMLWLVSGQKIAEMAGIDPSGVGAILGGIALTNGLPEAIVTALIVPVVMRALKRFRRPDLDGPSNTEA